MRYLIILSALALSGCNTFKNLVDTRGVQGCYVAGISGDSTVLSVNGSRTALWCSETLPEGYKFSFDDGRTKASIGDK